MKINRRNFLRGIVGVAGGLFFPGVGFGSVKSDADEIDVYVRSNSKRISDLNINGVSVKNYRLTDGGLTVITNDIYFGVNHEGILIYDSGRNGIVDSVVITEGTLTPEKELASTLDSLCSRQNLEMRFHFKERLRRMREPDERVIFRNFEGETHGYNFLDGTVSDEGVEGFQKMQKIYESVVGLAKKSMNYRG